MRCENIQGVEYKMKYFKQIHDKKIHPGSLEESAYLVCTTIQKWIISKQAYSTFFSNVARLN